MPAQGPARRRAPALGVREPRGAGGLIALGGPPLGGKSVLAAELLGWLPRAEKLELPDELTRPRVGARLSAEALLAEATRIWRRTPSALAPTLLLVARFASPAQRRSVRAAARRAGMRFLFVESRSGEARVRQRLFARSMTEAEARERLLRYRAALASYQPLSPSEQLLLPALRLTRVQSDLDGAVSRVLAAWARR